MFRLLKTATNPGGIMHRYIRISLLLVIFFLLVFNCDSPNDSPPPTKILISDLWFSDLVDTDGDEYLSYSRLNFDLDINKESVEVMVILWVRFTDPQDTASYYLYFESGDFTVYGDENQDVPRYIDIGSPGIELETGLYDFTLQVFPASSPDADAVASASWENFPALGVYPFEPFSEDQLPELSLSEDYLDFGTVSDMLAFEIMNSGGSVLAWDITSNRDWLSASEWSGSTTDEIDEIYVYVDRTVLSSGTYSGTLTIEPNNGAIQYIDIGLVVESDPFEVLFTNEVFTEISIEVSGKDARTIPVDGSTTYYFSTNPGTLTFYAETAGRTTSDDLIGLNIVWDYSYDVTGLETFERNLIITEDYFFIYFRNNGLHNLHEFYVNYGNSYQTYDNIYLPADNVLYRIGYYRAFSNTEVRAYWYNTSTWENWIQGQDFTLPFTDNQYALIENTSKIIPDGTLDDYITGSSPATPLAAGDKLKRFVNRSVQYAVPGTHQPSLLSGEKTETVAPDPIVTKEIKPVPGFSNTSGPRETIRRMEIPPGMKRPDLKVLLKKRMER